MLFEPSVRPRLFGVAPGLDFADAIAFRILRDMAGRAPEDMARVRILVNSGRTERALRGAFEQHGAAVLPRLGLIAELADMPLPGVPAAAGALARTLELASLVVRLADREPALASATAAFDLAESLAALLREMQDEGVPASAIDRPDLAEGHALHWEKSLAFVRIAAQFLSGDGRPDDGRPDGAGRLRRAVETLAARWREAPPGDPVIVAGSTGSRGTTALLIGAVARLPQGAVILPGFDAAMSAADWQALGTAGAGAEDHPQYRYARLMAALGTAAAEVPAWLPGGPPDPGRNRTVSLALAPAPVTDRWITEGPRLGDLAEATRGLSLMEAPSQRAEAEGIAVRIRAALEEGLSVAVVTPDRSLARRLAAALDRWGIDPDDSAGIPLSQTATGRLLRHAAAALSGRMTAIGLVVLLKHPLAASTPGDRGTHLLRLRELEQRLRRTGAAYPDARLLADWAGDDPDRRLWADWVARVVIEAPPRGRRPLADWLDSLLRLATLVSDGPRGAGGMLWDGNAGREASAALARLRAEAGAGPDADAEGFRALIEGYLGGIEVRDEAVVADPRVRIVGTIETRALAADLVIAAGLNEGTWPAQPPPDPWLSRDMRRSAGLRSPERQIGLSAHDFQQAVAAPEVMLTRSVRDQQAQTVPSRWLARLVNLLRGLPDQGGPAALRAMQSRGGRWLAIAAALNDAERIPAATRPAPRPPVPARPRALPVTAVRTLIQDPYAVYARRVLGLRRLDPLRAEPDARERGTVLHRIMERFVSETPDGESVPEAAARLVRTAEKVLARDVAWPTARRFWRARMISVAPALAEQEAARRAEASPALLETPARLRIDGIDFELEAKADRIDRMADGTLHILDYKSGPLPQRVDLDRAEVQLLLEGAMAERGAFAPLGPARVSRLTYLRLAPGLDSLTVTCAPGRLDAAWDRLIRLVRRYDDPATGYAARGRLGDLRQEGDYDHLARLGEWGLHDAPEPEEVG
ncbi:MAG: double-strand break repair protein AddB [Pseudomonadota bacterium]